MKNKLQLTLCFSIISGVILICISCGFYNSEKIKLEKQIYIQNELKNKNELSYTKESNNFKNKISCYGFKDKLKEEYRPSIFWGEIWYSSKLNSCLYLSHAHLESKNQDIDMIRDFFTDKIIDSYIVENDENYTPKEWENIVREYQQ